MLKGKAHFVANHRILVFVAENIFEHGQSRFNFHLTEAVCKFVFEENRIIRET